MIEVFAGFFLGIIASFFVWYVNYHWVIPSVKFSSDISRRQLSNNHSFYQVAFKNTGRRKILDIDVLVRIGVKGYKNAEGWGYHAIRTNASKVPYLSPEQENRRLVRIFDTRKEIEFVDLPSESISKGIKGCPTLEDVLKLGEDASVQVHIFGYDSFSGTRRHFVSKNYKRGDIRFGRLEDLAIMPEKNLEVYRSSQLSQPPADPLPPPPSAA